MKPCIFVAAGDISEEYFKALTGTGPRPFIFGIDGGYRFLKEKGVKPDIVIGDFDSLGFVPDDPDTEVFPVRKDKPDTMLAIDRAKELMFDTAFVLGAFGGKRLDHTISNLQQLFYGLPALRIVYLDDSTVSFALTNETAEISDRKIRFFDNGDPGGKPSFTMPEAVTRLIRPSDCYLSIFTQSRAKVDLDGTAYDGTGIELTGAFPLGVSNEMAAGTNTIAVRGEVTVMLCRKDN